MISIAMLGCGNAAAAYYLDRSADCAVAYYTGDREAPGHWCGHGAAALGLVGEIDRRAGEILTGVLDGRGPGGSLLAKPVLRLDPRGQLAVDPLLKALTAEAATCGLPLGQLVGQSHIAGLVDVLQRRLEATTNRQRVQLGARLAHDLALTAGLDPRAVYGAGRFATALAHAGRQVDVRRTGLDLVISAPKSVSVLYALGDAGVVRHTAQAHARAVAEALGYLERHTAHGLRGHQGESSRAVRMPSDGFVAAAFTHRTSRADDPQRTPTSSSRTLSMAETASGVPSIRAPCTATRGRRGASTRWCCGGN